MRVTEETPGGSYRQIFALIWEEASPFARTRIAVAVTLVCCASALTAVGPLALKHIVDGLGGVAGRHRVISLGWVVLLLASQAVSRALSEIRGLIYAKAESRMSRTLGERVFEHILRLPLRFHLDRQTGALVESISNGIQGYKTAIHTVVFSFLPVLMELATMVSVIASIRRPLYLGLFLAAVVGYVCVFKYAAPQTYRAARSASSAQINAGARMTDAFLNYEAIKCSGSEHTVQERVSTHLESAETGSVRLAQQFAINGLLVTPVFIALMAITLGCGVRDTLAGSLSVGTFLLINSYMSQVVRPIETLGMAMQLFSQGVAYLSKLTEILRERTEEPMEGPIECDSAAVGKAKRSFASGTAAVEVSVVEHEKLAVLHGRGTGWGGAGAMRAGEMRRVHALSAGDAGSSNVVERQDIEFADVTFSYVPGATVLKDVCFKVRGGRTLGIVGVSGSGKSTIPRLLVRFFKPDSGTIYLGGIPVESLRLESLRRAVAIVPQDITLFNDSIRFNVTLGVQGVSEEALVRACTIAQLHDRVGGWPDGYETVVGEFGKRLSGGERQRVAIARAIVRDPQVYVFDEATSSLDGETEMEITRRVIDQLEGATRIVIAHRLPTVARADDIVVLDSGTVVERGDHECLLARGGKYASLWEAQNSIVVASTYGNEPRFDRTPNLS